MADDRPETTLGLPIVEERAAISKQPIKTGTVSVRSSVVIEDAHVSEQVQRYDAGIDRVAVGREVDAIPGIREEGDFLYVPVVEEQLVVTKRLFLVEEIVLRRTVTGHAAEVTVPLRRTEVTVERGEREA